MGENADSAKFLKLKDTNSFLRMGVRGHCPWILRLPREAGHEGRHFHPSLLQSTVPGTVWFELYPCGKVLIFQVTAEGLRLREAT